MRRGGWRVVEPSGTFDDLVLRGDSGRRRAARARPHPGRRPRHRRQLPRRHDHARAVSRGRRDGHRGRRRRHRDRAGRDDRVGRRPRDGAVPRGHRHRRDHRRARRASGARRTGATPQAAGFTVGFATAFFALRELADVQPGQSVLIHAAHRRRRHGRGAAGQALGSRGVRHREPRQVGHVAGHGLRRRSHRRLAHAWTSSRSSCAVTGGRGVDVVLDSLAGEFVDASLRLLPRGGVFLEMGKTDIRDADAVAADPSRGPLPRLRPVRGRTRRRRQDPRRASSR